MKSCFLFVILVAVHISDSEMLLTEETDKEEEYLMSNCRMAEGIYYPPSLFSSFSCATCYKYMPKSFFKNKFLIWKHFLVDPSNTTLRYAVNVSEPATPITQTFRFPEAEKKWMTCCKAAILCCQEMRKTPLLDTGELYCPRTWDGWQCWPDTPAGSSRQSPCASHVYFHSRPPACTRYAIKECDANGTWYRLNGTQEWTDYRGCGQKDRLKTLLNNHIISFAISIVCLIPALAIFFFYKQLHVFRISMHKNLFFSLLFNGICVIIFEGHFMYDSLKKPYDSIVEANEVGCKLFYSITKYFRLTTYSWMFCEGFYLHKLIAAAFAEQRSMVVFYVIGWGIPILPVISWVILRQTRADFDCWTSPVGNYEWVLNAPMLLALVINLFFLGNIIIVLVSKLKKTHSDEPTQFRRAVRATLVLIPLFGLHFILFMYHPPEGACGVLEAYTNATYTIDGLQGGMVALIFCYLNNEVIYLLKRSYKRRKMIRNVTSQASSKRVTSRGSVSTQVE